MVGADDHNVGGLLGFHSAYGVVWAWISTMSMVFSFSVCAWHRRRIQRRREGLDTRYSPLSRSLLSFAFYLSRFNPFEVLLLLSNRSRVFFCFLPSLDHRPAKISLKSVLGSSYDSLHSSSGILIINVTKFYCDLLLFINILLTICQSCLSCHNPLACLCWPSLRILYW